MEHLAFIQSNQFQNLQEIEMNSLSQGSKPLGAVPQNLEGSIPMTVEQQNLLIEVYFDESAFYHPIAIRSKECQTDLPERQLITQKSQAQNKECLSAGKATDEANKSIFHNCQKHLITIIKKYMTLPKNRLLQSEEGPLAYRLWQAFMSTRSFNKKLLYTVFGVESRLTPTENLGILASEFPEFSRVAVESWKSVGGAQNLIRECIVEQARHLNKSFLQQHSSIVKFEEFYAYYCNFIREISQGPISKRVNKNSKKALLQTIIKKQSP